MISNETAIETTTGISLPPKTIVGYRDNGMPIYNVAGGSGEVTVGSDDDDDDDSSSDSDEDDSSTVTTQAADKWVPPTREDYDKLLAAKSKADSEAAARKRFLRDANLDPKTGKPVEKPSFELEDDGDETSATDQKETSGFDKLKFEKQAQRTLEREVAKAERIARSTSYSLIAEVPAALEDAGWNGKNLPRMIKLLDLDVVEVDADGVDVDTLAQQVTELKKDFPEFFKRTRMRDAAKEVADTEAVGGGKKEAPASVDEQDWKARMKASLRAQGLA